MSEKGLSREEIDFKLTKLWLHKDRTSHSNLIEKQEFPKHDFLKEQYWSDLSLTKTSSEFIQGKRNETDLPISYKPGWGSYGWNYDPAIPLKAIELGTSLIDTAEGYGFGKVEVELGKALKNVNLKNTLLASKVSRTHMSKRAVVSAGRRSQEKLCKTIDLYQLHWPHPTVPWEDTYEGLAALVEQGVIKQIGVCNHSVGLLAKARRIAAGFGLEIVSNQISYNWEVLTERKYILEYCNRCRITVIGHSPFRQDKPKAVEIKKVLGNYLKQGVIPIPGTNNLVHLKENLS